MATIMNNSKEFIKNRMLKHALNYWTIKNTDDLDPIVKLILEALSSELYNLSNEIRDTEVRILEKIANLLAPEFLTCPNTAHGLLNAQPVEPYETIHGTNHFYTQKRISSKKDETLDTTIEVFFTPVGDVKLIDAQVACVASAGNLFVYDENGNKQLIAQSNTRSFNENNVLWIGMQVNEKVTSIKDLSFCFEWKNPDPRSAQLNYQLLPLAKWHLNNTELITKQGISYLETKDESLDERDIFIDYNLLSLMEADIKHHYDHKFISIVDDGQIALQEARENYPQDIQRLYAENDLKKLNKKLVWLKIVFPVAIPQDSLDEVYVFSNCFPVMNRQLNEMKYRLKGGSNIIPLKTNGLEQFLSVKELSDEKNKYQNTPYRKMEEEAIGTYSLRNGGIERFDVRNAREYISYLLELLRSESSAFSVYGYDFIATTLREMNQRIALMEQKTKGLAAASEIPHYIMVKPFEGHELMYAEYWTTLAENANHIRSGTKFQQFKSSKVKASSLNLLTTTTGGKNRLKPEERLNAFRYGLITRNRIVTKEDIRNFCFYELGSRISNVSISKGIHMSANPQHGFTRSIDVQIQPAQMAKLDDEEWQRVCDQLQSKLTARSGMSNHYRVMLQH